MNFKELWEKIFGNYDTRLRNPFKIFLYCFEFTVWIYLLMFIVFSNEFRQDKFCAEARPMLNKIIAGEWKVVDAKDQCTANPSNITSMNISWLYPSPSPKSKG